MRWPTWLRPTAYVRVMWRDRVGVWIVFTRPYAPGFLRVRIDWWRPASTRSTSTACGKPGPNPAGTDTLSGPSRGACTREAGHTGFCYAGTAPEMYRLLDEAAVRYPDNLDAQRAYLRAALTPGARVDG